jgi:hypothetical protein
VRGTFGRVLYLCGACCLLFVPESEHVSAAREKARYELHRNSPHDPGYIRFLDQLVEPLCRILPAGAAGLDYGSGRVAVLAQRVRARGFACDSFDPHFDPDPAAPAVRYDFLAASEVFEHFRNPRREIERFLSLLKPAGIAAVMTEWRPHESMLERWHYLSDPTHVAFYHEKTFEWIARRFGLEIVFRDGKRVVILKRV